MPSSTTKPQAKRVVLLAEQDVIVRVALAAHLRGCNYLVLEAANAAETKAILASGINIDVLLCDAQLAGEENGFAMSQWVRRHRPSVQVLLTGALAAKIDAVCELCGDDGHREAAGLIDRTRKMMAERTRRMRRPSAGAVPKRPRVKGAIG